MTHRLWFSFALRVLGIWELLQAADHVVTVLHAKLGLFEPAYTHPPSYFMHGVADLLLALVLLYLAPAIAVHFYPSVPAPKVSSADP